MYLFRFFYLLKIHLTYKFINYNILLIKKPFDFFLNLGQVLHGLNKLVIKSMMYAKYKNYFVFNFWYF